MIQNIMIAISMCLLLIAAAHFIIPAGKYKWLYIALSLTGVILRVAVIIYLYTKGGVDTFGTDGLLYHKAGIWISRQLDRGTHFYAVKYIYTWYTAFVGLIYHIFGINRYIVSFINIALTYFSAVLLLKIALNLRYKFANASFVSLSFLFFPNLILWTSDSRKEALTIFICTLCCYCLQRFLAYSGVSGDEAVSVLTEAESGNKISSIKAVVIITIICILMWLCTLVRIYMFVPMAAGILLCLALSFIKYGKRVHIYFGLAVIICSVLIFFFTMFPLLENYHAVDFPDEIGDLSTDIANKAKRIGALASKRNILLATLNFLLLPYPGNTGISEISGNFILNALVSCEMLFWYICMLLMVPGISKAIRHKESFMMGLLAFLVSYIAINIFVADTESDTIYRYRSVITGLSLLFTDLDAIDRVRVRICSALGINRQILKAKFTPDSDDRHVEI